MTITEQFKAKRCVFSIECFPPKQTTQMDKLKDTLRQMQAMDPGFISVTFGAGGSAGGVSTAEVADYIQNELHVPTLAHLICMGNDETVLGERGVTVSGGQKQRISIARALLKNAPILILDDSVSAVDTRTEKIILDNLKTSRAGKTTLLIAHRISTVEQLDKIVFIEDGRVEAVGPHDELYRSCAEYRRMVDLQKLEDEEGGGSHG